MCLEQMFEWIPLYLLCNSVSGFVALLEEESDILMKGEKSLYRIFLFALHKSDITNLFFDLWIA